MSFPTDHARIDKWLWCVRLCKTRPLATAACRAGSVRINDQPVKPSREVRAGEMVTLRQGLIMRTVRVIGAPPARVAAKLLPDYYEDLTPASEFEKTIRPPGPLFIPREKGAGRPTKRERRRLDEWPG